MITPPPAHACTAWAREGKRRTWPQLQRSAMIYSNLSNATDVVLVYDLNDNETIRSIANVPLVFPSPQLKGHEKNKKIVRLFADLCERLNKAGEASCDDWSGCDIPELVDRFTKALQSWGRRARGPGGARYPGEAQDYLWHVTTLCADLDLQNRRADGLLVGLDKIMQQCLTEALTNFAKNPKDDELIPLGEDGERPLEPLVHLCLPA